MKTIQFREAVCEAMSEEMRRDESIYLMGEEVAEYNGAYKASKGRKFSIPSNENIRVVFLSNFSIVLSKGLIISSYRFERVVFA